MPLLPMKKPPLTCPWMRAHLNAFCRRSTVCKAEFPAGECPIRTALVTARAAPAHERVVRTLREWDIRIDESLFLGGLSKGDFLNSFGADVFFDDQQDHCSSASEYVATGHVPHGVANEARQEDN